MNTYDTLAYCGIFCGGCLNYNENMNCVGCRLEQNLVDDCPTRMCAMNKGLLYCGECQDFPCHILQDFYEDGVRHHAQALLNVQRIQQIGPEKWTAEQLQQHRCVCGRRKLWFADTCNHDH